MENHRWGFITSLFKIRQFDIFMRVILMKSLSHEVIDIFTYDLTGSDVSLAGEVRAPGGGNRRGEKICVMWFGWIDSDPQNIDSL